MYLRHSHLKSFTSEIPVRILYFEEFLLFSAKKLFHLPIVSPRIIHKQLYAYEFCRHALAVQRKLLLFLCPITQALHSLSRSHSSTLLTFFHHSDILSYRLSGIHFRPPPPILRVLFIRNCSIRNRNVKGQKLVLLTAKCICTYLSIS